VAIGSNLIFEVGRASVHRFPGLADLLTDLAICSDYRGAGAELVSDGTLGWLPPTGVSGRMS
jgi:hypothetical protein